MSTLNVDKVDPSTGTGLELGSSGDTVSVPSGATLDISASTLTPPATMPASSAANLTSIPGANITGTIAAVSGANLTSLNATQLGSGTVPTARLGSGTASSSTVLYGDQTYKAEPGGGKLGQVVVQTGPPQSGELSISGTTYAQLTDGYNTPIQVTITPEATSSSVLTFTTLQAELANGEGYGFQLKRDGTTTVGTSTNDYDVINNSGGTYYSHNTWTYLDTAVSTTSAVVYGAYAKTYGTTTVTFNKGVNYSNIICMEILG